MKRSVFEATDENFLNSIKYDQLQRSSDVKNFLAMVDTIDYNAFISIDAAWGDGKTFFVRQVEMTMKYHTKKVFKKEITEKEETAFQSNKTLGNLELQHTYLPIYFDAWLYDNHVDALMALLMVAIKQSNKFINITLSNDKMGKMAAVLDSIQFWKCNNWSNSLEKFKGKNILEEAFLLEDIRQMVKEGFNDIITEESQKMVIFIDELDRCRPTFAVEILESIKHYFDDERIVFVMSVNKSQLIHTVSKYYGNNFNSNLYLNKFFDINIQLPKADTSAYFDFMGLSNYESYVMKKFANELQNYYDLSLRDTTRYFQKIVAIQERYRETIGTDTWKVIMIFIPVICILDIVDIDKKQNLLSGKHFEIMEEFIANSEDARRYIMRLTRNIENIEENYHLSIEQFKQIYEFGFNSANDRRWYEGNLDIQSNFTNICLRVCNSI